MTINEQLHNSATHKAGSDPDCPVCAAKYNPDKIFHALERFIKGRAGLDPADYGTGREGWSAYQSEARNITKDRSRAIRALTEARGLTPARPELFERAFTAFSGRLSWDGEALHYCTGQYRPTEYRKAAASVLESYCAAWRAADSVANPRTYAYTDMADVRAANEATGGHWFERGTMRFFNTRICSRLIAGKRFITSERGPDERTRYTIREARPDGSIDTIGEFQQFGTLAAAKAHVLMEDKAVAA